MFHGSLKIAPIEVTQLGRQRLLLAPSPQKIGLPEQSRLRNARSIR